MTEFIEGRFSIKFVIDKMFESTNNPNYNLDYLEGFHQKVVILLNINYKKSLEYNKRESIYV